jgi:hypothetical protein
LLPETHGLGKVVNLPAHRIARIQTERCTFTGHTQDHGTLVERGNDLKLILEIDIDNLDGTHAADQIGDAIHSLESFREQLYSGREKPKYQSDVVLDSVEDDELIGNWRIEP